ncbi:MAG: hypothetical protein OEW92_06895 [Gammaproteobacteria bacterium]|nr:hypothetical protein [Gammaproteobacteria bacterium]
MAAGALASKNGFTALRLCCREHTDKRVSFRMGRADSGGNQKGKGEYDCRIEPRTGPVKICEHFRFRLLLLLAIKIAQVPKTWTSQAIRDTWNPVDIARQEAEYG